MVTPSQPPNQILAATVEHSTLVAVVGMANFKLAQAFRQAIQAARLAGSRLVVVDMAACQGMDSTFMGTLAAMGLAADKPDGTPAVLINLSEHGANLLRGLGVDRILKFYPAQFLPESIRDMAPLVASLQPIEAPPQASHEMAAMMFDAHETLTRVEPENLQRFKDVLEYLRKDIAQL